MLTHEDFVERLIKVHGKNFSILSKYNGNKEKMRFMCSNGHEFELIPNKILSGRGCQICAKERVRQASCSNTDKFIAKVNALVDGEYSVLGEYISHKTHILMRHNICGHEYNVAPFKFLDGSRCPICVRKEQGKKRTLSNDEFVKRFHKLGLHRFFEIHGKYLRHNKPVLLKCRKCLNFVMMTPHNLINNGAKCKYCSCYLPKDSAKSIYIEHLLKENQIEFIKELRFEECRDKRPLPFDFALLDFNLIIEFDGEQHFRSSKLNKLGKQSLEKIRRRDEIKNTFCKVNGIGLLRISFKSTLTQIKTIIQEIASFNDHREVGYKRITEMGGRFINKP